MSSGEFYMYEPEVRMDQVLTPEARMAGAYCADLEAGHGGSENTRRVTRELRAEGFTKEGLDALYQKTARITGIGDVLDD